MCAGCLLKNTPTNSKYVVNQKLEHFDDINITIGLEPNFDVILFECPSSKIVSTDLA
jgi:hypothetical protein